MPPEDKHTVAFVILTGEGRKCCGQTDSRSKKQEMVGLVTPKVVVTHLSSFLSSILLCGRDEDEGGVNAEGHTRTTTGNSA